MPILKTTSGILSHTITGLFVFIIAAVALNTWQVVLPNFHFDNSFSIAASRNVTEGNGYVTKQVKPSDISAIIYEPINKWPPGYSWLLAGITQLTGTDTINAVYILNAIVILFFLAGIYSILDALRFSKPAINGFVLFAGFFPYPFLGAWFADLAAVSFFMLGIGLVMQAHASGRYLMIRSVAAALLCSYCIFLKYLYLPVAILPLIVWGWHALRRRKMKHFRAALSGALIVMTAAILLLVYQSRHSGQPVYVNPTGKGFFPEHVLEIGALIPASLVDQEFLTVQTGRVLGLSYSRAELLLRVINYILLAALFFWVYKWWRTKPVHNLYAYIVLVVSAATAGLLLFLSLVFAPYVTEFTPFWTYVEELRYYAIVIVFIQQWVFWYFIVYKPQGPSVLYRSFRVIVIMIVLIGILHSAYYLFKQAVIKEEAGIHKLNEQTDISALKAITELRSKYPDLVICSNNHELVNVASLSGAPVLYDYNALNTPLRTSKPVTLVAILRNDFLQRFTPFMERYKPVKVDERYNFSFYLATIR
ncbi:MAG TPA: hypothetical protein VGD17_02670 [Chitinophagaceae bacterium]